MLEQLAQLAGYRAADHDSGEGVKIGEEGGLELLTDRYDAAAAEGSIQLRHRVQLKNIRIPYGD